jgi:CHAT domain-containing protein/tetratricopeptide (TPR) repeat protein
MDDAQNAGPLAAAARQHASNQFSHDDAQRVAPGLRGVLTSHIEAAYQYLEDVVNEGHIEHPHFAYALGEFALSRARADKNAELSGFLAHVLSSLLSGTRPLAPPLQRRRVDLARMAADSLRHMNDPQLLAATLYNVGNAYRTLDSGDRIAVTLDAIAYYESALLNLNPETDGQLTSATLQNLSKCYIDLTSGNRLSNLHQALMLLEESESEAEDGASDLFRAQGTLRISLEGNSIQHEAQTTSIYRKGLEISAGETDVEEAARWLGAADSVDSAQGVQALIDHVGSLGDEVRGLRDVLIELLHARFDTFDPATQAKLSVLVGDWYGSRGRPAEAIDWFLRSVTQPATWHDHVTVLLTVSKLESTINRRKLAIERAEQALDLATRAECMAEECRCAIELGKRLATAEHFDEAVGLGRRALRLARRLHHPRLRIQSLFLIGSAQGMLNPDASAVRLERALALARQINDRTEELLIITNLATMCHRSGNYDGAITYGKQAVTLARANDDDGALSYAARLLGEAFLDRVPKWNPIRRGEPVGRLVAADSELARSAHWYREALSAVERLRSSAQQHEQRMTLVGERLRLYDEALALLALVGSPEEALLASDVTRARTLADVMAFRDRCALSLRPPLSTRLRKADGELLARQAQYLADSARSSGDASALRLRESVADHAKIVTDILRYAPTVDLSLDQPQPTLEGIRAALADQPRTAVVVFSQNAFGKNVFLLHDSGVGSHQCHGVWTGIAHHWDTIMSDVVELDGSPSMTLSMRAHFEAQPTPPALRLRGNGEIDSIMEAEWTELIEPVHAWLLERGITRLVVVPPKTHRLAPFSALSRVVNGARRYLIDDFSISYAPSLLAFELCHRRRINRPVARSFGAVADPTGDLPFCRIEALTIAELFGRAHKIISGGFATRANLSELGEASYLHFACHGTFDMLDVSSLLAGTTRTALWLSPEAASPPQRWGAIRYQPLTSAEIQATLTLDHSRMVVLSACNTGMSGLPMRRLGDEQLGLAAAFLMAGAPTVVSSLWAVDDAATALLMERMYQIHLKTDCPISDALRDAQNFVRHMTAAEAIHHLQRYQGMTKASDGVLAKRLAGEIATLSARAADDHPYNDPYFWAAFIVWGD